MNTIILFVISIALTAISFATILFFIKKQFAKIITTSTESKNKDVEVLTRWLENMQQTMDMRLKNVQGELDKTTETLNRQAMEASKTLNERLEHTTHVIGKVQKELGTMSEIGRGMRDLQDFLKSPKLRGNIGEQVLKELLEQMLPRNSFELQHTFKTGEIVDALLKVDEGKISVDSKFPMENFKQMMQANTDDLREQYRKLFIKDVKKHINDIAKKYILPNEGTLDFALMYIPSEAIYYEVVVNNPELGEYSWNKRVLAVSPNVFYSYLKAILIGLEGKKVESRAKEILRVIRGIKVDADKFNESLKKLTKHISNAKNMADEVTIRYEKLEQTLNSLNQMDIIDTTNDNQSNMIEIDTKEKDEK